MADNNKKIKGLQKDLSDTIKLAKELNGTLNKGGKKNADEFERVARETRKFNDELKKSGQFYKGIDKLANKFKEVDSTVKDLEKELKALGVTSSAQMRKITEQSDAAAVNYNKLLKTTKRISQASHKLDVLPKKLMAIQKGIKGGFASKEVKQFIKSMGNLSGSMDPKKFESLKGMLEKGAINSGDIKEYSESLKEISNVYLKDMVNDFQSLKDQGVFSELDEDSKGFIDNLIKTKNAIKSVDELESTLTGISKIQPKVTEALGKYSQKSEAEISKVNEQLGSVAQLAREANEGLENAQYINTHLNNLKDQAIDTISGIKQEAAEMQLFPDDIEAQLSEIRRYEKDLINDQKEFQDVTAQILDLDDDQIEKKTELLKLQKAINGRIFTNAKNMEAAAKSAKLYVERAQKLSTIQWGEDQTKKLSENIYSAARGVKLTGEYFKFIPGAEKGMDKIAQKIGLIGENASKFKFGAALLTGAVTLTKAIIALEAKTSKMYQEVEASGLTVGQSYENVGESMKRFLDTSTNIEGLQQAARGVQGSFALSREEILGTVGALDKAGLAARNLEGQMKGAMGGITGTKDEIVGAATAVRIFSSNLGVADGEIAGMMGNMAFEFNSNMSGMKDQFTEITKAAHDSSMSSTRFLGVLGTSTAGLTTYAEQVSDTAKEIARLSNAAALTGKDVENLAKGAMSATKDTEKFATSMATLLTDKSRKEISESLNVEIAEKQKKLASSTDEKEKIQLAGQIKNMTDVAAGILVRGNDLETATMAETLDSGTLMKLQSKMFEDLLRQTGGDSGSKFYQQQMAKVQSPEMEELMRKFHSTGMSSKDFLEQLNVEAKENNKTIEDLGKVASEKDKRTGNASTKVLEAIEDRTLSELQEHSVWLKVIAAATAAAGIMDIVKTLASITSLGPLITTAIGGVVSTVGGTIASIGAAVTGATGAVATALAALPVIIAGAVGAVLGYGFVKLADSLTGGGYSNVVGAPGEWLAGKMGPSDEEAMAQAEANQKAKPLSKGQQDRQRFLEMKKQGISPSQIMPSSPALSLPTTVSNPVSTPSSVDGSTGADAAATASDAGQVGVNIFVNGNDEQRIVKVVTDTLSKINRNKAIK